MAIHNMLLARSAPVAIALLFARVPTGGEPPTHLAADPASSDSSEVTADPDISRLDSLAERIAASEALLNEKEALAKQAEVEARFHECRAEVAEATAQFAFTRAQCLEQLASEAQCRAEVEREKGDGTLMGCGLGILLALVSGGSAAPIALGGCMTGRALADAAARECGSSQCANHLVDEQRAWFREKGWPELPQCGGRFGLEVETPLVAERGLRVLEAGFLQAAGVRAGDAIVSIAGQLWHSLPEYEEAARQFPGLEFDIRFVRDEQLYTGNARIPKNLDRARPSLEWVDSVPYRQGARITWVAPWVQTPGLEQATVVSIDGHAVSSRDHLRELLRFRRSGDAVTLRILPKDSISERDVQLPLGGRSEPFAL
jgi:hypothetical protein